MSLNKILDKDIKQIKRNLAELIDETKVQYATSYKAIRNNNYDLVLDAMRNERKINNLQNEFTDLALWKLAKQSLVASDLRLTVGAILIAHEIELIADYAKWTGKYFITYKPTAKQTASLTQMFELLVKMLDLIDKQLAQYNASRKEELLILQEKLYKIFKIHNLDLFNSARNTQDDKEIESLLAEIRQIINLERAGEHLVNIQEIIDFIVHGKFQDIQEILVDET